MTEDRIARARTVLRFLNGEGPLDGHWFNERPRGVGPWWWRKHLSDITAALPTGDAVDDQWQPIETAPKDGTRILVAWEWGNGTAPRTSEAYWRCDMPFSGKGIWWVFHGHLFPEPTHWQPIPAPPAAIRKAPA